MNVLVKEKADLMVENFHQFKEGFRWEQDLVKYFGAMVYATRGKKVDIDKLKEIKKYIKSETSFLSQFRGTNELIFCNLLCFEDNYETFFKNMLNIYDKLKDIGFKDSTYLPLTAYTIVKEASAIEWNYRIDRIDEFYKSMKKNHFWLTSSDDYAFAAALAVTDLDVKETAEKIESCYTFLSKECFHKGNHLQTLCNILALGEEGVEEKCNKAIRIYKGLVENKCKLKHEGLASLGLLTLVTDDEEKMVREIKEAYDYIYDQDGYGFWSIQKPMRIMLASSLVSSVYVDEIKEGIFQTTLGNSINSILVAEQQAVIVGACAATAAVSASSTSC